jgi:hypothetical protein
MPRAKKIVEEVLDLEVVEVVEAEEVVDVVEDVEPEEVIVDKVEVVEEVEDVVEPVVVAEPAKAKIKKIIVKTGDVPISDFSVPLGFDIIWNEDKVKQVRVSANTLIEVIIPADVDFAKWVRYYKSLNVFGLKVIKFGEE